MVNRHNGVLLSHEKEKCHLQHMDSTKDYHPNWSKSKRDRQIAYGIT